MLLHLTEVWLDSPTSAHQEKMQLVIVVWKKQGKQAFVNPSNPAWLNNLKQTTPEATWTFFNIAHMLDTACVNARTKRKEGSNSNTPHEAHNSNRRTYQTLFGVPLRSAGWWGDRWRSHMPVLPLDLCLNISSNLSCLKPCSCFLPLPFLPRLSSPKYAVLVEQVLGSDCALLS